MAKDKNEDINGVSYLPNKEKAKFYGVGVGPGDPKLITLRAVEILQAIQVVAIPKSKLERESVAWEIAQSHCPAGVGVLELEMPMTADESILQAAWHRAAAKIETELGRGRSVAFLTLGDPSLYSTYSYLLNILRERLAPEQIETIPGITAMAAAAARVNWPLAAGNEPLVILPGLEALEEYEQYSNLVLMKVSRNLPEVLDHIQRTGSQAVLATRVGQAGEEIRLLGPEEDLEKVDYLSLVLCRKP